MSLEKFLHKAISSWMSAEGPDSDIVLSSRIRLARNIKQYKFPTLFTNEEAKTVIQAIKYRIEHTPIKENKKLELLLMDELQPLQKRVLVEKHLISPHLAENSSHGACLLSENEELSIMINEEDHIRIQCLFPGFQLSEALERANDIDDWLEEELDY